MSAHRAHEQCVTVGLGACGGLSTNVTAGAVTVFHDHALAEFGAEVLAHDPCQDVCRPTCREGNNDSDGLGRESLRSSSDRRKGAQAPKREGAGQSKRAKHIAASILKWTHKNSELVKWMPGGPKT